MPMECMVPRSCFKFSARGRCYLKCHTVEQLAECKDPEHRSHCRPDWTVRDSQAPKYFKSTLETITSDDDSDLVSAHIHLTGVAPSGSTDARYIIARVPCRPVLRTSC